MHNHKDNFRYRGYWVRFNPLNSIIWIEADGQFIGYANSADDAIRQIDELLD